jgi:hypothetical protein
MRRIGNSNRSSASPRKASCLPIVTTASSRAWIQCGTCAC